MSAPAEIEQVIRVGIELATHDAHANARDKGWWESEDAQALEDMAALSSNDAAADTLRGIARKLRAKNDGELIALMHAELSEAVEYLRKGEDSPSDHIPEFSGVEEEMADVLIRIFDFCGARNLRLGPAVVAKMRFNKTRPARHGGKAF